MCACSCLVHVSVLCMCSGSSTILKPPSCPPAGQPWGGAHSALPGSLLTLAQSPTHAQSLAAGTFKRSEPQASQSPASNALTTTRGGLHPPTHRLLGCITWMNAVLPGSTAQLHRKQLRSLQMRGVAGSPRSRLYLTHLSQHLLGQHCEPGSPQAPKGKRAGLPGHFAFRST